MFDKWMSQGDTKLNSGHTFQALIYFALAAVANRTSSQAMQLFGVCLRMIKWLEAADFIFEKAFSLAKTDDEKAKILRDWSMVALLRRQYDLALDQLQRSRKLLSSNGEPPEDVARRNEYWATISFLGEACRLSGDHERAIAYLRLAYKNLHGVPPYELNALTRLLAAVGRVERITLAKEAWELATQANSWVRKIQILTLLVNVRLADWIALNQPFFRRAA